MIHLCFSESLKYKLYTSMKFQKFVEIDNIAYFPYDLSIGSIKNINLNTIDVDNKNIYLSESDKSYFKEKYQEFLKSISNEDNDLIIWFDKDPQNICGFLYIINLLKNNIKNIYIINAMKNKNIIDYEIHSTMDINLTDFSLFLNTKRIIHKNEIELYSNEWLNLEKANTPLRIFKNNSIISVKENYFDGIILEHLNKEMTVEQLISKFLTETYRYLNYSFLLDRIKKMINKKQIIYINKKIIKRR